MDLVLWRHAEAEDAAPAGDDLARELTRRGLEQAERSAQWLARHLPRDARILCSPARRCRQTAKALGRSCQVAPELSPGGSADELLRAAGWPDAGSTVLVVGHQPTLGEAVARVLGMQGDFAVRKGAVWWLRLRQRAGQRQGLLLAVHSPELA
jgi:phosphohistidine phosphatase